MRLETGVRRAEESFCTEYEWIATEMMDPCAEP